LENIEKIQQFLTLSPLLSTTNHKNSNLHKFPFFSKVIINNDKIKVTRKIFQRKKGKHYIVYQVNVKGKIASKLGKIKHTEILSPVEFRKFMSDYLDNRF